MSIFYIQTESLCHVGVLRRSGRYPWGSGKRPFQSGGGPKATKKKQTKTADKKEEAIQKARETRERNRAHEAEKRRVLKEGTASDVLKFKSELTTQEMSEALDRIRVTSQLNSYAESDMKKFMDKVEEATKGVQTVTNVIKTGSDLYNAVAKIYNSTEEGKQKPLTLIGSGNQQKKRQE